MYQWGNCRRKRFGTTKNTQTQARGTNQDAIFHRELVASEAKGKPKNSRDKEFVGNARTVERKARRLDNIER